MAPSVWIAGITIGIDALLFPTDADLQALTEALLALPDAAEVDGPWAAHAVIVVTFKDTDATSDMVRMRVHHVVRTLSRTQAGHQQAAPSREGAAPRHASSSPHTRRGQP